MSRLTFNAIPKFHPAANYRTNSEWKYIPHTIERWQNMKDGLCNLDIDPDFQRAHVWTKDQQIAYVEFIIQGGYSGKDIYFNCVGWQGSYKGPFVLVDGKQRLNAVLQFLKDEIPAFDHLFSEYEDRLPSHCEFMVHVNNLSNRKAVLEWYLQMNSGGTPHTKEELIKVKDLLAKEK